MTDRDASLGVTINSISRNYDYRTRGSQGRFPEISPRCATGDTCSTIFWKTFSAILLASRVAHSSARKPIFGMDAEVKFRTSCREDMRLAVRI